jgi:hypothetical protein
MALITFPNPRRRVLRAVVVQISPHSLANLGVLGGSKKKFQKTNKSKQIRKDGAG